jgi:hypothetical protein
MSTTKYIMEKTLEIEYQGTNLYVEVSIEYVYDPRFGEDEEFNRGEPRTYINNIEILECYNDLNEEVTITSEIMEIVSQKVEDL